MNTSSPMDSLVICIYIYTQIYTHRYIYTDIYIHMTRESIGEDVFIEFHTVDEYGHLQSLGVVPDIKHWTPHQTTTGKQHMSVKILDAKAMSMTC